MREPKRNMLLAGDWHGHINQALDVIFQAERSGIDTIIQLGDFGIKEYDAKYLDAMQKYLGMFNMNLYFIDGNHEDFPRIYKKQLLPDGTRYVRDNIYHLPRGFRWTWHKISFLALGGAASISKYGTGMQKQWWPEELITDKDLADVGNTYADVMLTHDSPSDAPNIITDNAEEQIRCLKTFGLTGLTYSHAHREQLRLATNAVNPRFIFHGHYHKFMKADYHHQTSGKAVKIYGLDQGGTPKTDSTFEFDFYYARHRISSIARKDKKI